MATSKKKSPAEKPVEEAGTNEVDHGLNVAPSMPYYCTWLPGACPTDDKGAVAQTLPFTLPPMCPPPGAGAATIVPTFVPPCPTMPVICVPTVNPPCPKPGAQANVAEGAQTATIITCTGIPIVCGPNGGAQAQTVFTSLPPACPPPAAAATAPTTIPFVCHAGAQAQTMPMPTTTVNPTLPFTTRCLPPSIGCPPAQAQTITPTTVITITTGTITTTPITATTTIAGAGAQAQAQGPATIVTAPPHCTGIPPVTLGCPLTAPPHCGGIPPQTLGCPVSAPPACTGIPPVTIGCPGGGAQAQTFTLTMTLTITPTTTITPTITTALHAGAQAQAQGAVTILTAPPACTGIPPVTIGCPGGNTTYGATCDTLATTCTQITCPGGGAQAQAQGAVTILTAPPACTGIPPISIGCPPTAFPMCNTATPTAQPTRVACPPAQAQGTIGTISIIPFACLATAVAHCFTAATCAAPAAAQAQGPATVLTAPPNCGGIYTNINPVCDPIKTNFCPINTATACIQPTTYTQPFGQCPGGGAQAQTITPTTITPTTITIPPTTTIITRGAGAQAAAVPVNTAATVCTQVGCPVNTIHTINGCPRPTIQTQVTCPVITLVTVHGCPRPTLQTQITCGGVTHPPICFATTITQPFGHCPNTSPVATCPPLTGGAQAQGFTGAICNTIVNTITITTVTI